jgi:hypothetical protein
LKKATCYCCGKKGHYSNKCPEKDKCSKDEWAVKKAMMHAQAKSEAKRARELYHIVGTPTMELVKTLIKKNAMKNCSVTAEDVNNAEKIFGADMLSLRGKLTSHKSTPVREDVIEIPEELILQNCKIDLCIDIMYVNECGFMTTID